MIRIICKKETYTYNAYHMVKAFYPSDTISCRVEEKASHFVSVRFEDDILTVPCHGYPEDDEQQAKKILDRSLYRKLAERTGRQLAWGTLLGVRPAKLAMQKYEAGWDYSKFQGWFQEHYLVSREKTELAWKIAVREKELLDRLDAACGYSLYVGIPFCPSVCSYCSFSSGALSEWRDRVDDYLDALCKELRFIGERSKRKKLDTIYIGGGTPTSLDEQQLERLLECIEKYFPTESLVEYTIEAGRPDSITKGKLKLISEYPVTRISINPQTMQQKTLDRIGRIHTVDDIVETFRLARELGFDNINMDIIAGLPGEGTREMEDTLRQIRELGPDSLTVHSLAIKRAAKMGRAEEKANMGSEIGEMIEAAAKAAAEVNLYPYYLYRQKNIAGNFENVGYAKVDKAGIYNILIMEEKQPVIAAGAGASTKILLREPCVAPGSKKQKMTSIIRIENVKAIDAYINRIDEMIERKGEWLWR